VNTNVIKYHYHRVSDPVTVKRIVELFEFNLKSYPKELQDELRKHLFYLDSLENIPERVMSRFAQTAIERFNGRSNLDPRQIKSLIAWYFGNLSWATMQKNKRIHQPRPNRNTSDNSPANVNYFRRNREVNDVNQCLYIRHLLDYCSVDYINRIIEDTDWVLFNETAPQNLVMGRMATMITKFPFGVSEEQFKTIVAIRFGYSTWLELEKTLAPMVFKRHYDDMDRNYNQKDIVVKKENSVIKRIFKFWKRT
jgi:hypothetical protein